MKEIITHVFERVPQDVHVYQFDEMYEVFEAKEGSFAFETDSQRQRAINRWEEFKKVIGWTEQDQSSYKYIEQFEWGFAEKQLPVTELQESLDCAKIKCLFRNYDAEKLQRFIDMLKSFQLRSKTIYLSSQKAGNNIITVFYLFLEKHSCIQHLRVSFMLFYVV